MEWVKKRMYQARLQRNRLQENRQIAAHDNPQKSGAKVTTSRLSKLLPSTQKLSWLAGGVALGAMVVNMVWWVEVTDVVEGSGRDHVAGGVPEKTPQPDKLPTQSTTTGEMKENLVILTQQVQTLTASVSELKVKLQEIHTLTDSLASPGEELGADSSQQLDTTPDTASVLEVLPPPAAGTGGVSTSDDKDAGKPGDTKNNVLVATREHNPTAREIRPQERIRDSGPWVINLASLPQQADAERFVTKAESRGVEAEIYQVTVRGNIYWRVQVSGFTTATEAEAKAGLIKEKLGLKDVWVAKR